MKYILKYFKKYKKESILAPLFKMLEACFDLVVPLIVANMIDVGIANGDKSYILTRFGLLLAMAVFGLLCCVVAQFFAAKAAIGTATGLRHDLLLKIQSLSLKEEETVGSATLITRMTSDINQIQNGLNMFLRLFMRSPFIVFGSAVMAFTINSRLALIFVMAIAVLFVIVFGIMRVSNKQYKVVQKDLDSVTEVTSESLRGVRVIRAFSREEQQQQKTENAVNALLHSQLKAGRFAALLNPLTYVVVNSVIVLVLWLGAGKVQSGVLLSGNIIALINYISQILVELVKLASLITLLARSVACANRVGQTLDMQSSLDFGKEDFSASSEAVSFKNVGFCYSGGVDEALSNITFSAASGQTIGIIGGTGSGKTTLINLIMRFYDVTSGEVELFGKPIESYSKSALQNMVCVVGQKMFLFEGTIKSNLLLANPNADDDELWKALEIAQAAEFVKKKPLGLSDPVEQGGANLSGGQRQRLTIARALLAGTKIIILDDSFSALDFATDAALRKALKSLPDDITVFIISQRVGSIKNTDEILVLDDGRLVGNGTHESLMKNCGVYQEIYESQTSKEGAQ